MTEDLIERLRKRAEIRRQIPTRKSVRAGEPDRIADLLEEAAGAIEDLDEVLEDKRRLTKELSDILTPFGGPKRPSLCDVVCVVEKLKSDLKKYLLERDEAETKWHAHQKNVPCGGCEGGHDTYWKSIIESPQWEAWCKSKASDGWDWMECEACGHISQGHFQAFLRFVHNMNPYKGDKK